MGEGKIVKEIKRLAQFAHYTKREQIVQGIINSLEQHVIRRGDTVPSVNKMIECLGFARQTIVNAYQELIEKGVLESKNRQGYFVASEESHQQLKVCLVIYAFDTFQETFYETFRKCLGEQFKVDVFFHHNNFDVFQQTINAVNAKYGAYVIAPIERPETAALLEQLPAQKTLIVDRYVSLDSSYSYIAQEFRESSYQVFVSLVNPIRRFKEFVFLFKPFSAEPNDILLSFQQFVADYHINGVVKNEYESGSIEKDKVYFTIHNLELWEMLKDVKSKGLKLGADVGILSHNDDHVKEIIFDGITTFSVDFAEMGVLAAEFVKHRKPIKLIMPTELFKRSSL